MTYASPLTPDALYSQMDVGDSVSERLAFWESVQPGIPIYGSRDDIKLAVFELSHSLGIEPAQVRKQNGK